MERRPSNNLTLHVRHRTITHSLSSDLAARLKLVSSKLIFLIWALPMWAIDENKIHLNEIAPFMPPIDHFVRSRPKTLNWNATRHDFQRKILQDFSQSLRSSKICVFDGSIEEKAIRKFSQAMLSGLAHIPSPSPLSLYQLRKE